MYWGVTQFDACAGIEVTASHNPIKYNGLKIVKSGSQPLDNYNDFQKIKILAESQSWLPVLNGSDVKDIKVAGQKNMSNDV